MSAVVSFVSGWGAPACRRIEGEDSVDLARSWRCGRWTDRGGQCSAGVKRESCGAGWPGSSPTQISEKLVFSNSLLGLRFQICKMKIMVSLLQELCWCQIKVLYMLAFLVTERTETPNTSSKHIHFSALAKKYDGKGHSLGASCVTPQDLKPAKGEMLS